MELVTVIHVVYLVFFYRKKSMTPKTDDFEIRSRYQERCMFTTPCEACIDRCEPYLRFRIAKGPHLPSRSRSSHLRRKGEAPVDTKNNFLGIFMQDLKYSTHLIQAYFLPLDDPSNAYIATGDRENKDEGAINDG